MTDMTDSASVHRLSRIFSNGALKAIYAQFASGTSRGRVHEWRTAVWHWLGSLEPFFFSTEGESGRLEEGSHRQVTEVKILSGDTEGLFSNRNLKRIWSDSLKFLWHNVTALMIWSNCWQGGGCERRVSLHSPLSSWSTLSNTLSSPFSFEITNGKSNYKYY